MPTGCWGARKVSSGDTMRIGVRRPRIHSRRATGAAGVAMCVILLCLALPVPAVALDVDRVEWGFDGQVVINRFNLLSVLVSNPTATAFDGLVELTKTTGQGR